MNTETKIPKNIFWASQIGGAAGIAMLGFFPFPKSGFGHVVALIAGALIIIAGLIIFVRMRKKSHRPNQDREDV